MCLQHVQDAGACSRCLQHVQDAASLSLSLSLSVRKQLPVMTVPDNVISSY